jgi:fructose-1,6-bisphosphatase/inositol monophosphatase family enzyme
MSDNASRLAAFEHFALDLATVAGEVILPLFRADHGLEDKGSKGDGVFDPVTLADRGAEAAIRQAIAARWTPSTAPAPLSAACRSGPR